MEDIIQKYQKKKRKNTLAIIFTSLALAIGFNFYVHNSEVGKMVKWSVFDIEQNTTQSSDLYLTIENNLLSIKSAKNISNVKSVSVSLAYNSENVDIKNSFLEMDDWELSEISNNPWYKTFLITFSHNRNIQVWENFFNLVVEKENISLTESINLTQATFVDSEDKLFALSTSGVQY